MSVLYLSLKQDDLLHRRSLEVRSMQFQQDLSLKKLDVEYKIAKVSSIGSEKGRAHELDNEARLLERERMERKHDQERRDHLLQMNMTSR